MKSLTEYIFNEFKDSTKLNIQNELELHFYSEFILNESIKYSYFNIFEKNGSYIGQKKLLIDLSKELYNIIRNHEPENTIQLDKKDLDNYSNVFFKSLIIYLTNKTGYVSNESTYLHNDKLLNKVVIDIDTSEYFEYTDILKCLMHEMLHAYNNFKSYLTNSKFNLTDLTNKNSSYYKTIFGGSISVEDICKRILNNIRQWEQNAYISELSVELENNKFDINKYKTSQEAYKAAYEIFKNSDTWMQYSTLWNYLMLLNSQNKNSADILKFQTTYNQINNSNLTFNQIYKKLDGLFNKILKKIESIVPKIFYDYYQQELENSLDESFVSGRQNNSLIKFIQYTNAYDLLESVKPENGKEWEVYFNGTLDSTFTKWAKKWKHYPKIGKGWYAGGTVFKIVKIEDNKVYTEEDTNCHP